MKPTILSYITAELQHGSRNFLLVNVDEKTYYQGNTDYSSVSHHSTHYIECWNIPLEDFRYTCQSFKDLGFEPVDPLEI